MRPGALPGEEPCATCAHRSAKRETAARLALATGAMFIVPDCLPGLLAREASSPSGSLRRNGPWRACNFPGGPRGHRSCRRALRLQSRIRSRGLALGLKAGGYWPDNLGARASPTTSPRSSCSTPIRGGATPLSVATTDRARTAAASAVSIKYLARPDAKVLGMIGAGHQSDLPVARRARPAPLRAYPRLEFPSRDARPSRDGRRGLAFPSKPSISTGSARNPT